MTNEGYLPREIWEDILTRLPAKMVGQCKCICKHWRAVIEDPSFVELHHFCAKSRAGGCRLVISSDFSDVEAPVNGLICGYYGESKSIFIVNSTTKEFNTLPPYSLPSSWYPGGADQTLVSFGFDPSTKKYKVLHISRVKKQSTRGDLELSHCECEVFTLGTHSWRFGYNGICLGGVIHWRNFTSESSSRPVDEVVVAFDLKDERFRAISLPRGPSRMPLLVEIGGHLATCEEYPENEPDELWILEDYDNWVWVEERIMLSPTYVRRPGCGYIHTNGSIQTAEEDKSKKMRRKREEEKKKKKKSKAEDYM
ncbi:hypothetical protein Vadar_026627 [Vaccinium darrowii]|uniref:Uncharacterized protein n=1 Tax=Vaccinium darrowii TaxID=229202 RepID=A0ACB7ZMR5_9ERIC|nr:hypothetical protein Vadar_026627 [Vaccinium darrowii]